MAALIIESQQGEGGYVAPPPEFFQIIKQACEKYGCLYVADEVQSGAGRTGKMWSIEHSGVMPDMLTWGKGMGGDMPMAGLTYKADIEGASRGLSAQHLRGQRPGLRGVHDQHRPHHRPGDGPDRPAATLGEEMRACTEAMQKCRASAKYAAAG